MRKLTPLEIFNLLPKTNCKECGFSTCLAFAMSLAKGDTDLNKCIYIKPENKDKLNKIFEKSVIELNIKGRKIGGQEVLFRHEKTFLNPTIVGLKDNIVFNFNRAGRKYNTDIIFTKNFNLDKNAIWIYPVEENDFKLNLKPDIYYFSNLENIKIFQENNILKEDDIISIKVENLIDLKEKVNFLQERGFKKIIVSFDVLEDNFDKVYKDIIYIRHEAILNKVSEYKYPIMILSKINDLLKEASILYLLASKYVNLIIINNNSKFLVFNLLLLIDSIYTDPRMPLQVDEKIYKIGEVNLNSPFYITTNFSLTFNLVKSEVISSKVSSYILPIDTGGLSVLNAWAAGRLTPEIIDKKLKTYEVEKIKSDKTIILPGYLSVFVDKLENLGWRVLLGPKEASGIVDFAKKFIKEELDIYDR